MADRETGRMLRFLARDLFVCGAAGLLIALLVVFLLPSPFLRDLIIATNYPADLVWLLLLSGAIWVGRRRIADPQERAFWTLLGLALAAWTVVALFFSLRPSCSGLISFEVAADFLYVVFYGLILAATELDPDRESGRLLQDAELRLVGIAGPVIVVISLYSYLVIIPAVVDPEWFGSTVPSLILLVVLDFFLALRLLRMTQSARTRRWNAIYGLFALIFYLWGLIEANDLVNITREIPVVAGPVLDFLWFLPFPFVVTAVRLRHWEPGEGAEELRRIPATAMPKRRRYEWSLVVMAVLLPAVHFGSYGLGLMQEDTQLLHELTVLVYVVAVGVLELTANRLRALMAPLHERAEHAQRMEAIGVLAGGIAHDFNNILTIVLGQAQLLQRGLAEDDPRRHRLEEIKKAGRRAADLAGGLLAFARREHSEPVRLDLNTVIAESNTLLRSLLTDNIRLWIDYQPDLPEVMIDQSQIEQVVVNLVTNARDALASGGDLYISTRLVTGSRRSRRGREAVPPGRWVMLEVRDTGIGMSAEVRDRAFEPFFTTKPRAKGTGLGLAVVYGIVRQSGGEVYLESAPGEGTCFRIFLPPAAGSSPLQVGEPAPAEPAGRITGHVLVAEDDPAVRSLVQQVLTEAGFEVVTAVNGRRALDELHRQGAHFDLVLTDVLMPEVGGVELAREVAAADPSCQVLFMSGYSDESPVYRLSVEPGVRLLSKPFTPDQLLREVRRVLSLEELG
jgi:signal transduction histidine kinase